MAYVCLHLNGREEYLDICPKCHLIWFDPLELERLSSGSKTAPLRKELSPEAKKAIALAEVDSLRREREWQKMAVGGPDNWWELVLGFFKLPVEYNDAHIRDTPLATYIIAAAIVLATVLSLVNPNLIIQEWGLVPNQYMRNYGVTFVSSFLLHGGILHLAGNLYFLLVFGDNVEDFLGKKHYLCLVTFSALAGDLVHILADPNTTTPLIGASGGISGILAYYCLRFPNARMGILVWLRWIRLPVGIMLFFWICWQIAGVFMQVSGLSNISALAHLGGALVGIVYWWVTRKVGTPEASSM